MTSTSSRVSEKLINLRFRQSLFFTENELSFLFFPGFDSFFHLPVPNNDKYLIIPLFNSVSAVLSVRALSFANLNHLIIRFVRELLIILSSPDFSALHYLSEYKARLKADVAHGRYFKVPALFKDLSASLSFSCSLSSRLNNFAQSFNLALGNSTDNVICYVFKGPPVVMFSFLIRLQDLLNLFPSLLFIETFPFDHSLPTISFSLFFDLQLQDPLAIHNLLYPCIDLAGLEANFITYFGFYSLCF